MVLDRVGSVLCRIARVFAGICVMAIFVSTILQVFFRYFLNSPLSWSDEFARYGLVYLTFAGSSVGVYEGTLACVNLLVDKLPLTAGRLVRTISLIVTIAVLVFLLYFSIIWVVEPSSINQMSPSMQFSMSWVFFALPLGLGLCLLQCIHQLMGMLSGRQEQ